LPDQARYLGHYLHNDRAVVSYLIQGTKILDTIKPIAGQAGFIRTFRLEAHEQPIVLKLDDNRLITHPPTTKPESLFVRYGVDSGGTPDDLTELVQPGKPRWGKPLITKLERGDTTGAFAVDTLTLPYDNPHKALFFCTGLDFLADGRIALCTCHGDVWLVQVDESAGTVSWQRFATGLYHPLGLKVVKDRIVVLERGQLTRLHDTNNDGEADFYECLAHNWDTGPGEHAYDTCLETDPDGNFYFFKTGDTDLPTGGTLLKVSATGDKVSIFATGFRHPIGMGMSAQGIITGADQEGNWMPATRVDQYRQGGFYGDMRGHHRTTPPTTYDLPICWLPREVDNSAGGQVWIPKDASDWGELAGLPLHLSYGRCKPYVLLRQPVSQGNVQGGVAELGFRFLSGSCRGRFHAKEGSLYVCGLNGWQTAAKADGSLQRVRPTGKPIAVPIALEAVPGGIVLRFSQPLDKTQAENIQNYRSAAWNYRWSKDYGSKRWKPSQPNNEGQDEVVITSAKLQDERTVFLKIPTLQPVMQLQLGHNLTTQKGQPIVGMITMTLHELPKKE
jgi:hypothetical protein